MQTTVLLSSARIPRRILETWGNLLWLKTCKLQYYWARPEYWDGIWRLEEICCYWSHTSYSFIELGQNTEKDFGDLRKPVVSEVKQITVLLSSARILRRILATWGNLWLLDQCKLLYYWARPEYWEGFWRLDETCCYWSHANYSIIELGQNTEKGFGDLSKLVVIETMQTTVLLSTARILRRVLEIRENLLLTPCKLQNNWARPEFWEGFYDTWGNLLLLKPRKLEYYWVPPEYREGFWRLEETCCYWSHANYSSIELGQNTEKCFGELLKLVVTEAMQTTVLLSLGRILRRVSEIWGNCC